MTSSAFIVVQSFQAITYREKSSRIVDSINSFYFNRLYRNTAQKCHLVTGTGHHEGYVASGENQTHAHLHVAFHQSWRIDAAKARVFVVHPASIDQR